MTEKAFVVAVSIPTLAISTSVPKRRLTVPWLKLLFILIFGDLSLSSIKFFATVFISKRKRIQKNVRKTCLPRPAIWFILTSVGFMKVPLILCELFCLESFYLLFIYFIAYDGKCLGFCCGDTLPSSLYFIFIFKAKKIAIFIWNLWVVWRCELLLWLQQKQNIFFNVVLTIFCKPSLCTYTLVLLVACVWMWSLLIVIFFFCRCTVFPTNPDLKMAEHVTIKCSWF